MNLVLKTPPPLEPLELLEAKIYLKLDDLTDTSEDDDLRSIIIAAREYCEGFQNRAYITQVWQQSFRLLAKSSNRITQGQATSH